MIATPATEAWYVFGVVDASSRAPDGDDVRLVADGPLAAVVGAVPIDEFGQDALLDSLNDRAWLEEHARGHEDVLLRVAAVTTVVPFRFGVVYRALDDVCSMLRARRDELASSLERVRGRVELGVKAWADRARIDASLGDTTTAAASGRAYLERRRTEQDRTRRVNELMSKIAQDAHTRLSALAVEAVANRPHPRELTGRDETMILNGAYLVDAEDALRVAVHELDLEHGPHGVDFEVTGPWPPHNFVEPGEHE